ncbi:hypothetical protein FHK92_01575 [Pseudomonas brassicacearum subsp. neoaurantiaca]|uniref:Uncharacterized protein n=1 Tax=Pseudomonas brassicacearum subsp. neoaurantiaca TaxID=494916 RepID=A0A7V8UB36_9PSED|nr:hypothetical protein [Pseudomonas brassicacearum subsp. neoaurantiaca]
MFVTPLKRNGFRATAFCRFTLLFLFRARRTPVSSVGASLLAMTECQSTSILDVRSHSRAGSLPQVRRQSGKLISGSTQGA